MLAVSMAKAYRSDFNSRSTDCTSKRPENRD